MDIIWKDVVGYEGLYRVNNMAEVISLPKLIVSGKKLSSQRFQTEKILKQSVNKDRRAFLNLYRDQKKKLWLVHRIVAMAFHPNPLNLPEVNHKDGNPMNNLSSNLEWSSCSDNILHAYRTGLRLPTKKPVLQMTRDGVIIMEHASIIEAAAHCNVKFQNISSAAKGIAKTCGGFIWKFKKFIKLNLSLYQQTKPVGAGNSLVMAISKKTAVNIILHSFELPGPYTGQTQLHTFAGIDNVMWYYQLFESPDGTPTGVVRNYFDVEPNANTYATRDDLYLTADISDHFVSGPDGSGKSGYAIDVADVDESLIGWNWSLERIGQGTREVGVKYVKTKVVAGVLTDTTNDDIDATGWRLLPDGDYVGPNEEWCIHFLPQLQSVATPTVGSRISATRILTANTTLDNSAIGQAFWLKGGAGYFEVILPDLATIPDNEEMIFMSDGGSHINVGLKCVSGQSIQWYKNKADLASDNLSTRIIMGQQQKLSIYKMTLEDSSIRFLISGGFEDRRVGEIITQYSKIPINTIFADGSVLSRTTYAALWEFVQTLDASALVTATAWENVQQYDGVNYKINYGKYHLGDGSTTFGIPRIYAGTASGVGFLRMVDGVSRLSASFQIDTMPDHQHEETIGDLPSTLFGKGKTRDRGNYNFHANNPTDLTGHPGLIVGSAFQDSQKLSYESRPANFGVYGLICI